MPLHVSPNGARMETDAHFQSLSIRIFRSRQQRNTPSRFPSQTSLRERCPISRALVHSSFYVASICAPFKVLQQRPNEIMLVTRTFHYITVRVHSKGAPPPGFPTISEFPVNGPPPPSMRPNGAHMERGAQLQSFLPHIVRGRRAPCQAPQQGPKGSDARPLSPPSHICSCNITSIANSLNTLEGTFIRITYPETKSRLSDKWNCVVCSRF
jgi:hypothetical protein